MQIIKLLNQKRYIKKSIIIIIIKKIFLHNGRKKNENLVMS